MNEVVEYKSNGHPDTLTDNIVEACATFLDAYYLKKYGRVLHYNVDKALFLAGNVKIQYGGGRIIKQPEFILGGQVSNLSANLKTKLRGVIKDSVCRALPNLIKFKIQIKCNSVSSNLIDIASHTLAGDTSFGVGYYPLSNNEQKVITLRNKLNAMIAEKEIPVGEAYKIMLSPRSIIVSAPLYANNVRSKEEYWAYKHRIEGILGTDAIFNPDFEQGFPYLTLTGSSIECGDDGSVGRGNRYNGLITPNRPMTIEAYHGKNNHNHTGKLLSKLAFEKAKEICIETGRYTEVIMLSTIGRPINECEVLIRQ